MNTHNKRLHAAALKRGERYHALRALGWTLERIAQRDKISKQRVAAILKRNGAK